MNSKQNGKHFFLIQIIAQSVNPEYCESKGKNMDWANLWSGETIFEEALRHFQDGNSRFTNENLVQACKDYQMT